MLVLSGADEGVVSNVQLQSSTAKMSHAQQGVVILPAWLCFLLQGTSALSRWGNNSPALQVQW